MPLADLTPLIPDQELDQNINIDQINLLYARFRADFIDNRFQISGKNIQIIQSVSKVTQYNQYAETFVHIITREITYNARLYDCNRANRVHWIKPILLAHPCKEVLYYKWQDDKGVCKEHFWFFAKDFMVVLKDVRADLQIVTAFCVDKQDKARFYERFVDYRDGNALC